MSHLRYLMLVLLMAALTACSTTKETRSREVGAKAGGFFSRESGDGPGDERLAQQSKEPKVTKLKKSRYGNAKEYTVAGKRYTTLSSAQGYQQKGVASWYGKKFHGRLTSSREEFDMYQLTAAHRSLPIPTYARVTNLDNGKSIIVKINDRGPFHDDRIIDLSYAAAVQLDVVKYGTANVEVRTVSVDERLLETLEVTQVVPKAKKPGTYIQLGAFSVKANANTLESKVAKLIPAAALQIVTSTNNKMYTVRLGPLRSKPLVDQLLVELSEGGITDYTVILNQP